MDKFVADKVLTVSELHLTVTTGEAFAGAAGRPAVTDVRLELGDRVEVTLAHIAPVQAREVVGRRRPAASSVAAAVGRVRRRVNLLHVHLQSRSVVARS